MHNTEARNKPNWETRRGLLRNKKPMIRYRGARAAAVTLPHPLTLIATVMRVAEGGEAMAYITLNDLLLYTAMLIAFASMLFKYNNRPK